MIKNLYLIAVFSLMTISNFLIAEIDYQIQDIGTLQTYTSKAIDLNNNGQILGWYTLDKPDPSGKGKCFFLRETDGSFYLIPPLKENDVDWRFLTDDGKVYGTNKLVDNTSNAVLFVWDKYNGILRLDDLPGREVIGVNKNGQALISSISETIDGINVVFPAVWENGVITKLKGLEGNLGTESEFSCGVAINNNGDVIGNSRVSIIYKNNLYMNSIYATLWKNGNKASLHKEFAKNLDSYAVALNDVGDILIKSSTLGGLYLDKNGTKIPVLHNFKKMNNIGYIYSDTQVYDVNTKSNVTDIGFIDNQIKDDPNSIWWSIDPTILKVNDSGYIIAEGQTIYGEKHAILLTPTKSN